MSAVPSDIQICQSGMQHCLYKYEAGMILAKQFSVTLTEMLMNAVRCRQALELKRKGNAKRDEWW